MSKIQKKNGGHRLRFRDIVREKYPDFEKLGLRNAKWSPWF